MSTLSPLSCDELSSREPVSESCESDLRRRFVLLSLEVRLNLLRKIGEAVEHTEPENAAALPNLTRCLKEINDALGDESFVPAETLFEHLADTVPYPAASFPSSSGK